MRTAAALLLLPFTADPAVAADDILVSDRGRVAELVTLTKLAPLLCPDIATDEPSLKNPRQSGRGDRSGRAHA